MNCPDVLAMDKEDARFQTLEQLHERRNDVGKQRRQDQYEQNGREFEQQPETGSRRGDDEQHVQRNAHVRLLVRNRNDDLAFRNQAVVYQSRFSVILVPSFKNASASSLMRRLASAMS